jgi:hypothetical protein
VEGQAQYYDYRLVATILHGLEKDNLRFGQVEEDLGDDGVIRRFVATVPLKHPDSVLNPNTTHSDLVQHAALRVCELIDNKKGELCGPERAMDSEPSRTELRFGSLPVYPGDLVQFPFLLPRDLTRLGGSGVQVIEARSILAVNFDASGLNDAIVIFGSTARGRGDYHVTPLDVLGGETAGVVVLANEIVDALSNRWLVKPSWLTIIIEKLVLIVVSTVVIVFGFWYWHYRQQANHGIVKTIWKKLLSHILAASHFILVVLAAVTINGVIIWLISVQSFRTGELVDPVTPVVAAVLDIVVDLCAIMKEKAGSWADRWLST